MSIIRMQLARAGAALALMVAGTALALIDQAPAAAASVGPTQIVDTRSGAKITPAAPYRHNFAAGAIVTVLVTGADESGIIEIFNCAAPASLPPMVVAYSVGEDTSNLVRLSKTGDPVTEFCFAPTGPTHLVIDEWTKPGPRWAALTTSTVFDGTVTVGTDGTTLALPGLDSGATGASLLVTLPNGGNALAFGCGTAAPARASVLGGVGVRSAAVVELGSAKTVCVRTFGAAGTAVKVKVELTGQFTTGVVADDFPYVVFTGDGPIAAPGLEAVTPARLFDTRTSGTGARRGAGQVYELDLSTQAPGEATAVVMNVTATDATANGFVTVWPCDIARPTASNLNYVMAQTVPNQVVVALAASGKVCFYTHTPVHLLADLGGWYLLGGGSGYRALAPSRLFDTRTTSGRTPVATGGVYTLDLKGKIDVSATAVTMNVTVTEPAVDGYLTVYPCDATRPLASNLNYARNQTVPNLVTVKLAADQKVCFFAQQRLHLLADLAGDFEPTLDSGYYGLAPERLVDTRAGTGAVLAAGTELRVAVPFLKLDAAVFNVTVTEPTAPGFVTVYPCGTTRPVVSNLNYVAGQTVPNLVSVRLDAQGAACFYALTTTHLVVDLSGVYSPDPYVDARGALTTVSVRDGATIPA